MERKNKKRITSIKKTFLFLLILFFFGTAYAAYAEETDFNQPESTSATFVNEDSQDAKDEKAPVVNWISDTPEWSLILTANASNYKNFSIYTISGGVTIQMDMNEILGRTGFDFSPQEINCTIETVYAPTLWGKLNAGLILINHFNWYFNSYYEYDFLPGLYISYSPVKWFNLKFSGLYQLKTTHVYELTGTSCPWFDSHCPAFSLETNFYPLDWLGISVSLSSYDIYKYFLFFSPIVRASFDFKCNEHLFLSISGRAQFVDFFTLSANFNNLGGNISAKWRF